MSHTLSQLIARLGGTTIAENDLDWASDIPAGNELIGWLVAQGEGKAAHNDQDLELTGDNALGLRFSSLALETEEIETIRKIKQLKLTVPDSTDEGPSSKYLAPSRLKLKRSSMEVEADMLQDGAKVLRRRLQAMKLACQNAKETIASLNQELKETDASLRHRRERLSELSIEADTVVSTSHNAAQLLIRDLLGKGDSRLIVDTQSVGSCVETLASLRDQIIRTQEDQARRIEVFQESLPTAREIEKEFSRLQSAAMKSETLIDVALTEELDAICGTLGSDGAREVLHTLLEEDTEAPPTVNESVGDIRAQLERAWLCDQVAALRAQGEMLDSTIANFEERLIPPMKELHQSLSTSDSRTREAEALISVLIEELEEIADDVQEVKNSSSASLSNESVGADNALLESQLKELLTRLNKQGSVDDLPLVLLDKNDIMSHLRAVMNKLDKGFMKEAEWTNSLPERLNEVAHGHDALLSAVYHNSAVNTSPPFGVSSRISGLAQEAEKTVAGLRGDISNLTKVGSFVNEVLVDR
ncbi:hypothetical protein OE88DRAFT_1659966 [Heliocybe sulcata]|uniref:Uncharacterized protein n=1 Tax=Heliocybe sulcata TaxID=5364 RepID=A0A5C3N0P6_9AGAM|nr:hypothetical protein OE88DRAFT_1659966 [Heliocybe sulcata]